MDRFLSNNNMVKGAAILIAVLLWLVVRLGDDAPKQRVSNAVVNETVSNVAVNPVYDNVQYAVMSIEPKEVTVDMTWKESAFLRSSIANLQVEADLTNLTEGTHDVVLKAVGVSTNIVTTIKPYTVKVTIEKIQHKQVPVEIKTTGSPAEGYQVGQPVIRPNRVNISVPQSMVDQVDSARAKVNIEGAKETIIKQVKLTVYDWNGRPMEGQVSPQVVDVEIPITSPFKLVPFQVKLTGQPADGYSIAAFTQEPETITAYAAQDVLNKLDVYDGLELDVSGFKETRKLDLTVPLKTGISSVTPSKISVTVEIVPSTEKVLEQVPVVLTGAKNGLNYTLPAEFSNLRLNLIGAPAILNAVRLQDVQATVDVSTLSVGSHELPVVLNLPLFVKNQTANITVRVDITNNDSVEGTAPGNTATPSPGATPSGNGTSGGTLETHTPTPTPTPADTPAIVPPVSPTPTEQEGEQQPE